MNIYLKVIKVMESIQYLKKDDTVGSGANKYKALTDEKVKKEVRDAMIANKLIMFRTNVETEMETREYEQYNDYKNVMEQKVQRFAKVKSTYKIVNAECPEETIEIQSIGHGVDPQDKAAGKALTYASKYALLDTFLIPTGDDTDKIHSDDIDTPVSSPKKTETKPTVAKENGLNVTVDKPKAYKKNPELSYKVPGEPGFKTISQSQRNRLLAIGGSAGMDKNEVKSLMQEMFNIESSTELDQYTSYKLLVAQIEK